MKEKIIMILSETGLKLYLETKYSMFDLSELISITELTQHGLQLSPTVLYGPSLLSVTASTPDIEITGMINPDNVIYTDNLTKKQKAKLCAELI